MSDTHHSLPGLFEESVRCYSQRPMMWEKRDGAYSPATYLEIHREVCFFASGLISLGIQRGDRIALLSEGRNAWVIAELGVLYTGGVAVPISSKIEESSELEFRLSHSESRILIVSGSQLHRARKSRENVPGVQFLILLDSTPRLEGNELTFDSVCRKGQIDFCRNQAELNSRWQEVREDDPATICYTSGTTADPKGAVLTHRNYTANLEQCDALLLLQKSDRMLLILPWDHSFTHTAGIYLLIKSGGSIASVQAGRTPSETFKNIPANIKEIQPTYLFSVPSLARNFRKNIEKGIREKGAAAENLFRWGLRVAYLFNAEGFNRGLGWRRILKPIHAIFDWLVFRQVRLAFGGELRCFIGGGALLDIELQRFFYALGIPMLQGYGLTEASPVISANVPGCHKLGSSGRVVPNLKLKICDEHHQPLPAGMQGEIVVQGENVMAGYWRNERATREVLQEGWLYTGDRGYLDPDGFLFVLGREKSLLIGNDGEKYSPEGIEEAIVAHAELIDQIMLYNDQAPFTIALVVPNQSRLLARLKENYLDCLTPAGQIYALDLLNQEIRQFRPGGRFAHQFPAKWVPSTFAVLEEGFTEQNRLLNSTLKMVRSRIISRYQARLQALYTPQGKAFDNPSNRQTISRMKQ
jgi:long-chain acyl-CoA synthetase